MTTSAKEIFAEKLRDCREAANLSQVALASAVGRSGPTLSRAENRDHSYVPPRNLFNRILQVLEENNGGCSQEDLKQLERAWLEASKESLENHSDQMDPVVRMIRDVLADWKLAPVALDAFYADLRTVVGHWQDYQRAQAQLDEIMMYDYARSDFDKLITSLKLGDQYTQPRLSMRVLFGLARTRRYLGEAEEALYDELNDALAIAEQYRNEEPEEYARILLTTGDFYRRLGQLEYAWKSYEESKQAFRLIENRIIRERGLATIERKQAGTLLYKGDATSALSHCQISIKLCIECEDVEGQRKGQQHLAWAKALLGNYSEALDLHRNVLDELNGSSAPLLELSKAKRFYADVLRMCGKLEEALRLYTQAREDLRQYPGSVIPELELLIRGPILLGMGQTYRGLQQLNNAQAYLEDSHLANKDDPFHTARTIGELGKLAMDREDFEEAKLRFKVAKKDFENQDNLYYATAMEVNQAELLLRTEAHGKARELSQEVITRSIHDSNLRVHSIRARIILANIKIADAYQNDPLADYIAAHRLASDELANPFLCREITSALTTQLTRLKQDSPSNHQRLCIGIKNWISDYKPANPVMRDELTNWFNGLEPICEEQL